MVFAGLAALGMSAAPLALQARHAMSEAELMSRIDRENNPVKKAKLEIKLGGLKLSEAASAFDHDQSDSGAKLLDAYFNCMKQAWSLLQASGRDPNHKPQGFMALDIALRENARLLLDLQQRTPFEERGPIVHVAKQSDALHTQVLAALFPGGKLEPAPAKAAKPQGPPASALRPGGPPI
ncbi:MAG TPA: hypothetical protein VL523_14450 [Terriglobia bacterium]|nr:hypothetical protein [Terriglobia bacterium]